MRVLVPILAVLLALLVVWSIYVRGTKQREQSTAAQAPTAALTTPADAAAPTGTTPSDPVAPAAASVEPAPTGAPAAQAISAAPLAELGVLRPAPAAVAQTQTLGSVDQPDGADAMEVRLTAWGAGVMEIKLARYFTTPGGSEPYQLLSYTQVQQQDGSTVTYFPFAARSITINGQKISLQDVRWHKDDATPGRYYLDLLDEQNQPKVRLARRYVLGQGSGGYDLVCHQTVENLADGALAVIWEQNAHVDPPTEGGYLGDQRKLFAGYFQPSYDSARRFIYTKNAYHAHPTIVKELQEIELAQLGNFAPPPPAFWPSEKVDPSAELVWFGTTNRYFALVTHPLAFDATRPGTQRVPSLLGPDGLFQKLDLKLLGARPVDLKHDTRPLLTQLTSRRQTIAPGETCDLSLGLFAGPRKKDVVTAPPYNLLGFDHLLLYELGCTWCTFQPLARLLLRFLELLHNLTFDWGVSIIILVLVVRGLLHPITKKGMINMAKMGKQMQALQPEIEKLKKKYGDDQQKFQQEQMKLWRERGVNPFNMLGCLPMLLQTPIWIALYAMLYFAIELRQQPAFYGVFQAISGGKWSFLADLSGPDNFLVFSEQGIQIPLIFIHLTFHGINILPILMGIVYFIQQQMTIQPAMNEQQAQQQKMMKWMTLLFPFMLYSAPSGLTLYMVASSISGIIDSYFVRKHIKRMEADGTLLQRKAPKPGGLVERLTNSIQAKMLEAQQMQQQNQQQQQRPPKQRK